MAGWPFGWRNETEEAAHEAVSERVRDDDDDKDEEPKSRRKDDDDDDDDDPEIKSDGGVGRGNY